MVYTGVKPMLDGRARTTRRVIAERNLEAILDAAQRLLERREQPNISAVALEADLSRPTVYAHFRDREQLVEALVERAVRRATLAIESAEPERGPAVAALQRVISASWQELGRNEEIVRAAAELSTDDLRHAHVAARGIFRKLVERGVDEGVFRANVPADWLVTSFLALAHAAAEAVRHGELESGAALAVLSITVTDLFVGRTPAP
jgi:AcrR family transcriptional regulator